jgi:hypothetical protein
MLPTWRSQGQLARRPCSAPTKLCMQAKLNRLQKSTENKLRKMQQAAEAVLHACNTARDAQQALRSQVCEQPCCTLPDSYTRCLLHLAVQRPALTTACFQLGHVHCSTHCTL